MSRTETKPDATQRRGFLRGLGLAAGAAAAAPAAAERSDTVPAGQARKETEAGKRAARHRETPHVQTFHRTNRF